MEEDSIQPVQVQPVEQPTQTITLLECAAESDNSSTDEERNTEECDAEEEDHLQLVSEYYNVNAQAEFVPHPRHTIHRPTVTEEVADKNSVLDVFKFFF